MKYINNNKNLLRKVLKIQEDNFSSKMILDTKSNSKNCSRKKWQGYNQSQGHRSTRIYPALHYVKSRLHANTPFHCEALLWLSECVVFRLNSFATNVKILCYASLIVQMMILFDGTK